MLRLSWATGLGRPSALRPSQPCHTWVEAGSPAVDRPFLLPSFPRYRGTVFTPNKGHVPIALRVGPNPFPGEGSPERPGWEGLWPGAPGLCSSHHGEQGGPNPPLSPHPQGSRLQGCAGWSQGWVSVLSTRHS